MNQLEKINDFLGTPTLEQLWYVSNEKALNFMQNVLPKKRGLSDAEMKVKFSGASPTAIQLLRGLLAVDPKNRFTALGGLSHPYLAGVREAAEYEKEAGFMVDTVDIESMELTDINLKRMMFQEIVRFHDELS